MRYSRKLVVLAVMALAAMAAASPSASAQSEPLAHNQSPGVVATVEPGGTACPGVTPSPAPVPAPQVTTGGCRVHVSGNNGVLVAHVFGIESVDSTCNIEFDARLDASGEGYLTHVELTQGTQGTCTRRPCGAALPHPPSEGRAWSAFALETNPGTRALVVMFCWWPIQSQGPETHCHVTVPFTEPTNHRYSFSPVDVACAGVAGFRGEQTVTWNTEVSPATNGEGQVEQQVEINHT